MEHTGCSVATLVPVTFGRVFLMELWDQEACEEVAEIVVWINLSRSLPVKCSCASM